MDQLYNMFKCGSCKRYSTAKKWNVETAVWLRSNKHSIEIDGQESDLFVCPKCGEEQPRHEVSEVSNG